MFKSGFFMIGSSMKFWISKNSEVPVREQITTQVSLAVASGDLAPGDRLPSTREISRRYGVHPNTVAAAYRKLVEDEVLEFRHGSGYFVCEKTVGKPVTAIDSAIDQLLRLARESEISADELMTRIRMRTDHSGLKKVLLIESDEGLRDILIYEIDRAVQADIASISFQEFAESEFDDDIVLTAFFDEKPKIEPLLKDGAKCIFLNGRSVATVLSAETRPTENQTIGVASGWNGFLTIARIMLTAAKIEPGNVVVRSTQDEGWEDAVSRASFVICDSLTATRLSSKSVAKPFSVISDESIEDLVRSLN
jgi:DNA-binding transcriptional regulator YhcF (GntR family)